jgi:hypothetical protein
MTVRADSLNLPIEGMALKPWKSRQACHSVLHTCRWAAPVESKQRGVRAQLHSAIHLEQKAVLGRRVGTAAFITAVFRMADAQLHVQDVAGNKKP